MALPTSRGMVRFCGPRDGPRVFTHATNRGRRLRLWVTLLSVGDSHFLPAGEIHSPGGSRANRSRGAFAYTYGTVISLLEEIRPRPSARKLLRLPTAFPDTPSLVFYEICRNAG